MSEKEVIADYVDHDAGEREVVDWTRPDGTTHRNIPVVFLRRVAAEDYLRHFPHMRGQLSERRYFWEVSVD